jgi:hypothetical protein
MNTDGMRSRRIEGEARHDEDPRGSNAERDVEHGRSVPRDGGVNVPEIRIDRPAGTIVA